MVGEKWRERETKSLPGPFISIPDPHVVVAVETQVALLHDGRLPGAVVHEILATDDDTGEDG